MSEYLVGVKVRGGNPIRDYLRIEFIEAASATAAIELVANPNRPAVWVTEFSRNIPAGMAPRTVDYSPRPTGDPVSL